MVEYNEPHFLIVTMWLSWTIIIVDQTGPVNAKKTKRHCFSVSSKN